jgi:hypothetical protein
MSEKEEGLFDRLQRIEAALQKRGAAGIDDVEWLCLQLRRKYALVGKFMRMFGAYRQALWDTVDAHRKFWDTLQDARRSALGVQRKENAITIGGEGFRGLMDAKEREAVGDKVPIEEKPITLEDEIREAAQELKEMEEQDEYGPEVGTDR